MTIRLMTYGFGHTYIHGFFLISMLLLMMPAHNHFQRDVDRSGK